MHGSDVALVGVSVRKDSHVLVGGEEGGKISLELAAVVGLQTGSRSETSSRAKGCWMRATKMRWWQRCFAERKSLSRDRKTGTSAARQVPK
jgi:hypothetical protein